MSRWRRGRRVFSEEELSELDAIFNELFSELEEGALLIVEGPSDEEVLRASGLVGRVLRASSLPWGELYEQVSAARCTKAIVLTDLDSEGRRLKKEISQLLRSRGVKVDGTYWVKLSRVVKGRVCELESVLRHWVEGRRTLNYRDSD